MITFIAIAAFSTGFLALTAWLLNYATCDRGTRAAPRGWVPDAAWLRAAPLPGDLPTWPTYPELAHEEDWEAAQAEDHSGVIVANITTAGERPWEYQTGEWPAVMAAIGTSETSP